MAFEANQHQISFLFGKKIYSIPRNQRRYVWNTDNWKDLLEDLDFLQNSGKDHFFGSIVLNTMPSRDDDVEYYEIVDGQQRITTTILILIVIAQIFKERGENALFQGLLPYIQTTNINNETASTLFTDVHPCIMALVSTVSDSSSQYNTLPLLITNCITNKKQDEAIEKCLKYYYEKLCSRSTDQVASFRNALISTNYINIKTTGEEDAYTVFEILNARGMDLEDHELLKNFILRYTTPINNIDIARQEWNTEIESRLGKYLPNFLKHHVAHKYGIAGTTKNRAVYDAIKKNTSVGDVNRLFADLKLKAKYYQQIVCESNIHGAQVSEVDRVMKFMSSNRSLLFRPIYLSLLHQNELGNITEEELTRVMKCIQYFFVCYNLISKETSNKISEGIQKYAAKLENEYSRDVLKGFLQHLKDRMPTKTEFRNTFRLIGYSNHCEYYHDSKNKQRAEMALTILEQIKSGRADIPEFTIEHILPDSQDRENAIIGNLMPLEENINRSCEDKPLEEKISLYEHSNFTTARNVANRYRNDPTSFNVNTRTTCMADELYNEIECIVNAI